MTREFMKKIYYITYSSIPSSLPSSLQIIKICENLSKNKYEITLIKPGTGNKRFSIKNYYGLRYNVNVKEFASIDSFPQGLKFYLYSFYCLFFILKKGNSITITRNYFVCYLLLLFKKKVVLEIHHDTNIEGRITKFILKYFNFLNKKNLINIVAISNSVKNLFINKYKVEDEKITVLPSGSSIKVNQSPKLCNNKRLKIGYFGSISPSKGINTLIKLSKIDQGNDYYIYGGSREEISKIKKKNINKNLFLHENVPYFGLPKIMLKMDILTIPYTKIIRSVGEVDEISKYTSPLKLFDYLAVGKIIISSDLKVLREVISSKNAYFVSNYENIFEWKKNITMAKNSKKKILIMSKNNLRLSKEYDHAKRVKKYI
jgi:glycosyltransferase involved in cell wall biosynthesis